MRSNDPSSHENEQKVRRRYVPKAAFALAERLKAMGVKLGISRGPWRTDEHLLNRRGRNGLDAIPIVTNGETEVMVDTLEHAIDLAGLLNYSGVDTLNPVPDLTVPLELQATKPA